MPVKNPGGQVIVCAALLKGPGPCIHIVFGGNWGACEVSKSILVNKYSPTGQKPAKELI